MANSNRVLSPLVRGAYDLQKLRIQTGLRLCANFHARLVPPESVAAPTEEVDPHDEEAREKMEKEAAKVIDKIKIEYKRVTDGIVAKGRELPPREKFVGSAIISSFAELTLINSYLRLEEQERKSFRGIELALEEFPLWNEYLLKQRGIGPASAGVMMAYFDINRAVYPSQFWAYSGLDVGPDGMGRSRRKEHLVEREYTDKEGNIKTKMSVTFNPWLQARLIGAMGPAMIKSGSPWRAAYDQYKHRLQTDPDRTRCESKDYKALIATGVDPHTVWTPKRIHRAAVRYMLKCMLLDLWKNWRQMEGLPVVPPYIDRLRGHGHKQPYGGAGAGEAAA